MHLAYISYRVWKMYVTFSMLTFLHQYYGVFLCLTSVHD